MTVADLKKELDDYPDGAEVGFADHDADEHQVSSFVRNVRERDPQKETLEGFAPNVTVLLGS